MTSRSARSGCRGARTPLTPRRSGCGPGWTARPGRCSSSFAVDAPEVAAIALNSLSNERAMTTLRDGFAGRAGPRFLSASAAVRTELPGCRTRASICSARRGSQEAIKAMDPPELERWLAWSARSPGSRHAGRRRVPFGPAYRIADRAAFRQRYPHLDRRRRSCWTTPARPRRRAGCGVLAGPGLNNTSLVFVLRSRTSGSSVRRRRAMGRVAGDPGQPRRAGPAGADDPLQGESPRQPQRLTEDAGARRAAGARDLDDVVPHHEPVDGHPQDGSGGRAAAPGRTLLRPDEDIPAGAAGPRGSARSAGPPTGCGPRSISADRLWGRGGQLSGGRPPSPRPALCGCAGPGRTDEGLARCTGPALLSAPVSPEVSTDPPIGRLLRGQGVDPSPDQTHGTSQPLRSVRPTLGQHDPDRAEQDGQIEHRVPGADVGQVEADPLVVGGLVGRRPATDRSRPA